VAVVLRYSFPPVGMMGADRGLPQQLSDPHLADDACGRRSQRRWTSATFTRPASTASSVIAAKVSGGMAASFCQRCDCFLSTPSGSLDPV
jgi:hypothetical protein